MNINKGLCLLARVILPVTSPPIENGCIIIRGDSILKFGRRKELNFSSGDFTTLDCGDSILFPAFVNAHAHLEYTCLHGKIEQTHDFSEWIKRIISAKKQLSFEDYRVSWEKGAKMLEKNGCGVVANIDSIYDLIPDVWSKTSMGVFSFFEILGIQSDVSNITSVLGSKINETNGFLNNRVAVSPHSLYSTSPELLKACFNFLKERKLLSSIHIAESREEYEMFKHKRGELIEWLRSIGRNCADCGNGSPVKTLFNYSPPEGLILAHANYVDDEDVGLIRKNRASVVHCPRSFAFFGHEQFHLSKFLKARINVCIGTDSLASVEKNMADNSADDGLNMFSEMRQFASVFKDVSTELVLKMATVNGAEALGLSGRAGEIREGAVANIVGIPFDGRISDVFEQVVNYKGNGVGFSVLRGKVVIATDKYRFLFS